MKFYTCLALAGLAAADMTTIDVKKIGSMGLKVMYEVMDGELMLTSQIRPLNNLVKNKTATSLMQVVTGRELTADEISKMSRNPPEKPDGEPPASTGYFQGYTEDAEGTSANTFEQNCTKAGEEEMP